MKALILLLLTALSAFGQYMPMADPAFVARANYEQPAAAGESWPNYYPTNIAGYAASSYFVGASYNGSGIWTNWIDRGTDNIYDFTNTAAGSYPGTTTINGYTALTFDGTDWFKSKKTNAVVLEVAMLVKPLWNDQNPKRIAMDKDGAGFDRVATTTRGRWKGVPGDDVLVTNAWTAYFLYQTSDTVGGMITNLATYSSTTAGAATYTNVMGFGGRYSDGANGSEMQVLEFVVYSTNLTTALRSNIFRYWTNRYQITP